MTVNRRTMIKGALAAGVAVLKVPAAPAQAAPGKPGGGLRYNRMARLPAPGFALREGNDRIGERAFFRPLLLFVLSSFGKRSLRYQMHTGRSYV